MRITSEQRMLLKESILSLRPNAQVYLFGSRADDNKKGGDIDILILDDNKLKIDEHASVERKFWNRFGEQKLDLVCFSPDSKHPFKRLILLDAIPL